MKQTQWTIAIVVLAVMVFVVTFAMNYLGSTTDSGGGGIKPEPEPGGTLQFTETSFPPQGVALEREVHSTGHYDFWFTNPTDKPVTVGLEAKGCTCTSVEAFLMPED